MRTSSSVRKLFRCCLLLFPLFLLATGCGTKQGTVSGTVYYKGKPLPGGNVRFFPEGQGGSFYSAIGSDGSYSMSKLPPGSAKITVVYSPENPLAKMKGFNKANAEKGIKKQQEIIEAAKGKGGGAAASAETVTLPDKYGDPDKSGLKVDVTGGSQTFDIKME